MPDVEVRDGEGTLIHTYEIAAYGLGTLITDQDLFDMAKRNAIEDGLVSEEMAEKLTFSVTG